MEKRERRDHFGRLSQGLANDFGDDPRARAEYEFCKRESIEYLLSLGRVAHRHRLGQRIDPADEPIKDDLPVLRNAMGGYIASWRFTTDIDTYVNALKSDRVPKDCIRLFSMAADAYNSELR